MNSPEHVARIYTLTQEVKRLKEFTSTLEREKEQLDDLYTAQNVQIGELKAQNESLHSRISRLLPLSERVSLLEDKVMLLETENAQYSKKLIAEKSRNSKNEANISEIMFQRDEALQKVDLLTDQLNHLQNEYENALRRGNDELQMHEQSRKKLLASEQKWNNELMALRSELTQANATIEQERKHKLGNSEVKQYERDEQILSLSQSLEKAEDEKRRLENDLIERNDEILRLNDMCGRREKHLAELTPYLNECLKLKREIGEYKHMFKNQSRLFQNGAPNFVFADEEQINDNEQLYPEPVFLFVKPINNESHERDIFVEI